MRGTYDSVIQESLPQFWENVRLMQQFNEEIEKNQRHQQRVERGEMKGFTTSMTAQLAQVTLKRFYTAKLEGLTDQAAFEEVVRIILECYEETRCVPLERTAKP